MTPAHNSGTIPSFPIGFVQFATSIPVIGTEIESGIIVVPQPPSVTARQLVDSDLIFHERTHRVGSVITIALIVDSIMTLSAGIRPGIGDRIGRHNLAHTILQGITKPPEFAASRLADANGWAVDVLLANGRLADLSEAMAATIRRMTAVLAAISNQPRWRRKQFAQKFVTVDSDGNKHLGWISSAFVNWRKRTSCAARARFQASIVSASSPGEAQHIMVVASIQRPTSYWHLFA